MGEARSQHFVLASREIESVTRRVGHQAVGGGPLGDDSARRPQDRLERGVTLRRSSAVVVLQGAHNRDERQIRERRVHQLCVCLAQVCEAK